MEIMLREVIDSDLPIFFEHQREPEGSQMAAYPSKDRDSFMAHWSKIRMDESNLLKTILILWRFQKSILENVENVNESGYI